MFIFSLNKIDLKRKNKRIILLVALTSCCFTSGQGFSKDSSYLKKIYKYTSTNNDSIFFYVNKLKKTKNECIQIRAKNFEAKAYYQEGNLNIAKNICLSILKNNKNKNNGCYYLNKSNAYVRLFWIYINQKEYQKAHEIVLKRKKLIENNEKKDNISQINILSVYQQIATLKNIMGYYDESRNTLKKIYPKFTKISHNLNQDNYYINPNQSNYFLGLNQSAILNMIGESYLKSSCCHISSELDSASLYFKKAFEIAKTFKPLHNDSEILYNIRKSEILIAKEQYNKALQILKKWSSNAKELKINKNINYLKAICFFNLNNSDSTLHYGKKVIADGKEKGNSKKKPEKILEILANQYYKNKQLDSATKYSKLAISEIKIIGKNKDEINKAHHKHEIKNIENIKDKIILKNNKTFVLFFFFMIMTIILINISPVYQSKKIKLSEKKRLLDEKKRVPIPQKKIYSIDPKLEQKIINGIKNIENTGDYLSISFNLNKFSKSLQTNTSYVSYTINNQKGITFKQYYTSLRIEYMIKKLREDSMYKKFTIQYLGELVGYKNASAFTRAFKKHQGITPSEFIKQL